MMQLASVLTTIQEPTASALALAQTLGRFNAPLIVIGDKKGPSRFELPGAHFYPVEQQLRLPFKMAGLLPFRHYSRKNLGYLIAFSMSADCIYETDDDNAPMADWSPRSQKVAARKLPVMPWVNVYRIFKDAHIWPRGFPLDKVNEQDRCAPESLSAPEMLEAPIQQGLANGAPDVDALWRLLYDRPVEFDRRDSVWLPAYTYCPFNSQSTWWWPQAYPLMYLPSYCSFRMTDIWRGFVAQRCLWELGQGLVFHAAEVFQERNVHDLMRDFKDEVPGYLNNDAIVGVLNGCQLSQGPSTVGGNLRNCYQALVDRGFIPADEMTLVDAWLEDLKTLEKKV